MCTSSPEHETLRTLWIEAIADTRASNPAFEVVLSTTDSTYSEFLASAGAAELASAEEIADALYLFCRVIT